MKVLITGGAGFIGHNLARYLLGQRDISGVRVIDDFSTGDRRNLEGIAVELVEGSILDYSVLVEAARGMDAIVHLGAIPSVPRSVADPRSSHDANATGTLNVLEAAREAGVGYVTVASSSSVYGANPTLPKNERDWTRPMSPYAVSKLATEAYTIAYQFSYGLPTLAFRFFNVYGPGQAAGHAYAAVIPKFLDATLNGRPIEIQGDGTQSRDFTYVDTLCAVIHKAVTLKVTSKDPVNLAFGSNTSLLELADLLGAQLGHPLDRVFVEPRVGDVKASQADSSSLVELFPDVTPVPLEEGTARTIEWFRSKQSR